MTNKINIIPTEQPPSPLKNLTGAAISGVLSVGLYFFTLTVAQKLANSPHNTETLAARVAALVRTMLLGLGSGATMIFAVIALGLVLLTIQQGIQLIIAKFGKQTAPHVTKN
ncbi:DUF3082 domain-containing protein [Tumidithrix helvetica PCC 7403]|uniref:DUF3082 domain-containing protein n=1 Tax=Tumidithrix helvetica TaxID=3457545 RepID=UPI003CB69C41